MRHGLACIALLLAAAPRTASACACCDGSTKVALLGWSKSGKSVLLREVRTVACTVKRSARVYRIGSTTPTRRLRPRKKGLLSKAELARYRARVASYRRRYYAHKGAALARRDIRLRRVRLKPGKQANARFRVTVQLRLGGRWRTAFDKALLLFQPDDPSGRGKAPPAAFRARAYRASAAAKQVLLLVSGFDSMPGTGHGATSMHWVKR